MFVAYQIPSSEQFSTFLIIFIQKFKTNVITKLIRTHWSTHTNNTDFLCFFLMILITSYERTLIRVLRPRTDMASQRFRWISLWRAPLVTFGYFIFYMYLYLYILWSLATLSSIHICTHARKHRNLCDRSNWHWLQSVGNVKIEVKSNSIRLNVSTNVIRSRQQLSSLWNIVRLSLKFI